MAKYYFTDASGNLTLKEYRDNNIDSVSLLDNILLELEIDFEKEKKNNYTSKYSFNSDKLKGNYYICACPITPGGRVENGMKPEDELNAQKEWRIQIQAHYYNYIYDQMLNRKHAIQLGIYNYENCLVFCAWNPKHSTSESSPISTQVSIETIAKALDCGFCQDKTKSSGFVCAFKKEYFVYFLNNCKWLNTKETKDMGMVFNDNDFWNISEKLVDSRNKEITFNKIYFGAPGTGKSNTIEIRKNTLCSDLTYDEGKPLFFEKSNIERVTFHPNYSYAQFVGTYKPVSNTEDKKNPISYEFVPGPFIRILERSLRSLKNGEKDQKYLLIIEEINRANVAAVFGDMFQLLDRKYGLSEYAINTSKDLHDYLVKNLDLSESNLQELRIPSNMYIWATMNSADQGVFPMDAAFKRRWDFEYLPIDEKNIEKHLDPKSIDIKDTIKKINEDTDLSEKEKKSCSDLLNWKVAGKKGTYNWYLLRKEINKLLKDKVDWINEDKLLGPWFIKPDEGNVISAAKFTSKVLMYLYEDVVKIDPKKIFKGGKKDSQLFYSEIANNWEDSGVAIFNFDGDNISSKIGYEGQQ